MKLVTVFLLVTLSICSYSATAFFLPKLPLPVNNLPLDPLGSVLSFLDPLKQLLKTLGISVEHLVEGLRKCVDELGPEASESVKKLLCSQLTKGAGQKQDVSPCLRAPRHGAEDECHSILNDLRAQEVEEAWEPWLWIFARVFWFVSWFVI
ncbi:Secretoglobin family 3A member 2 [Galemys pyrenaicus]|uniref:Secretoglobin family 3A member 2 n=1 Tax=Galemys pyrenaicus TaxID=202257 RepID=A0A8J5Z915_GALPY|nr:Secretoglobin family 3A member 2 [Galemys pyrenaicus]